MVHALCEVVERDVQSQLEFFACFAEPGDAPPPIAPVDPATLPGAAGAWVDRLRSAGHDVFVQDATGDAGVATFRTVLVDYDWPVGA